MVELASRCLFARPPARSSACQAVAAWPRRPDAGERRRFNLAAALLRDYLPTTCSPAPISRTNKPDKSLESSGETEGAEGAQTYTDSDSSGANVASQLAAVELFIAVRGSLRRPPARVLQYRFQFLPLLLPRQATILLQAFKSSEMKQNTNKRNKIKSERASGRAKCRGPAVATGRPTGGLQWAPSSGR